MSPPDRILPPKKDVATALLEGPSVFVHLDPRKPGVAVPAWLARQPRLVLEVGLNMAIPIHDLVVGDEALSCTLSFNRSPFWCKVPWSAVFALVGRDGRGIVWPEDVPPEVAAEMPAARAPARTPKAAPAPAASSTETAPRPARPKKPRPAAIAQPRSEPKAAPPAEVPAPSGPAAPRPASAATTPRRKRELPPYLRVVK